eukprot:COSAG06_NODE_60444_length_271_cov_0.453488_1_plen_65_part_01
MQLCVEAAWEAMKRDRGLDSDEKGGLTPGSGDSVCIHSGPFHHEPYIPITTTSATTTMNTRMNAT